VKIKGKKLLMCMAAIFVFGGAKAQGENAPLATMDVTLQKAIEIALAENPTIKVAEKEISEKDNDKIIDTVLSQIGEND
jgi:hypothetical protein